jgi:Lon protease-like protein
VSEVLPTVLPLFPLGTVLFPGGPLALRIFEPRYLELVRRCSREQEPFGVVLILAGLEAGPVAALAATGTTARLTDFDSLPDGLLGIACRGERRFRLVRRWQQRDGLHLGEVEYLAAAAPCPLPPELAHLGAQLRALLPRLGGPWAQLEPHYEDAGWVASRWAEILPLAPAHKQALLELADPLALAQEVAACLARQPPSAQV